MREADLIPPARSMNCKGIDKILVERFSSPCDRAAFCAALRARMRAGNCPETVHQIAFNPLRPNRDALGIRDRIARKGEVSLQLVLETIVLYECSTFLRARTSSFNCC